MESKKKSLRSPAFNPISNLGFLHVCNDGYMASLSLLLPFIQKDLNIDFSKIGVLSSLLNSAGVILALPAAFIAMTFGGYRVLVFSMILYATAFIITGVTSSIYILAFAFILASIGFGLFHPISFALIAKESNKKNLGSRMGNFTAVGDIGRVGIAACVTVLVSIVNWRNTAFIYGAIPVVILVCSVILFHDTSFLSSRGENVHQTKIHGLHSTPEYIIALVTSFIDGFASSSLFVFIPFLFVYRGASPMLIGSLTGAFFVGNMLGKLLIGKISDKIDSRKVFIFSELGMAVLLIILSMLKSIALLAVTAVLLGAVTKGTVPALYTIIAKAIPDKRLNEKAYGIVSFFSGIAAVIAPLLYGILAQKYTITTVFHVSAVFALIAILPLMFTYFIYRNTHTELSA